MVWCLSSLMGELIPAAAQEPVKVPLRFFTAAEAKVIQAACERIFPSDESGPGQPKRAWSSTSTANSRARMAKISIAIPRDRGLNRFRNMATRARKRPRRFIAPGSSCWADDFAGLSAEQQDLRLEKIQETYFFQLLAYAYGGRYVLRSTAWRQHRHGWLEIDRISRTTHELPV